MRGWSLSVISGVVALAFVLGIRNCNNSSYTDYPASVDTDSIEEVVDTLAYDSVAADTLVDWY